LRSDAYREGKQSPTDFGNFGLLGFEQLDENLGGIPGLERRPTSKYIGRSVVILGPCVDRNVGLGDRQYAGDPLWTELMEGLANYVRPHAFGGFIQRISDVVQVIKKFRVTLLEFQQKVQT
jgi:hypothetical protein